MLPIQAEGKWGFIDETGHWLVTPRYQSVRPSEGGDWMGMGNDPDVGVPFCEYLEAGGGCRKRYETAFARPFQWGWSAVLLNGRFQIIDRNFKPLFKLHAGMLPLDMGPALLVIQADYTSPKDGIWGACSREGKVVIPFEYEYLELGDPEPYGAETIVPRVIARQGGLFGALDEAGREIIPCHYEQMWGFRENRAFYKKDGRWGILDEEGHVLTDPVFPDEAMRGTFSEPELSFFEGYAVVFSGGKAGFADREGRLVRDYRYEEALSFRQGRSAVCVDGLWGYVDLDFAWRTPPVFEAAGSFSEGAAAVCQGGRWGYLRLDGTWLIPPKYRQARPFRGGYAAFSDAGRKGYVDAAGREIFPEPLPVKLGRR